MDLYFDLGAQAILANENGSAMFPTVSDDSQDSNQDDKIVVLQNMN